MICINVRSLESVCFLIALEITRVLILGVCSRTVLEHFTCCGQVKRSQFCYRFGSRLRTVLELFYYARNFDRPPANATRMQNKSSSNESSTCRMVSALVVRGLTTAVRPFSSPLLGSNVIASAKRSQVRTLDHQLVRHYS